MPGKLPVEQFFEKQKQQVLYDKLPVKLIFELAFDIITVNVTHIYTVLVWLLADHELLEICQSLCHIQH